MAGLGSWSMGWMRCGLWTRWQQVRSVYLRRTPMRYAQPDDWWVWCWGISGCRKGAERGTHLRLYVVHYWGSEREEMPRQGHGQICDSTSQLWGQSKGIGEKKKIKGVVMKLYKVQVGGMWTWWGQGNEDENRKWQMDTFQEKFLTGNGNLQDVRDKGKKRSLELQDQEDRDAT